MSLDLLVFSLFQMGETGIAGGGRLLEPTEQLVKSMVASCEMSLRFRKIFSPSGKFEKECVLPFSVNFTANGKAHRYLMSCCVRIVRSGLKALHF